MGAPRYIPIPVQSPEVVSRVGQKLAIHGGKGNATVSAGHVAPVYVSNFSMHVAVMIFTIALGIALAILIVMLLKPPRSISTAIYAPLSASSSRSAARYPYVYVGIAAVLRKLLDRLRSVTRCARCTPLEISQLANCQGMEIFVEVYHEVVYGGRAPRIDVSKVREVVDKCVSG